MFGFLADLRYALRMLRRAPGFAAAAGLTLAIGIGANTAIFSVVDAVLLQPLPLDHPERLVIVCSTHRKVEGYCVSSPPDVSDWRDRSRTLEEVGLAREWSRLLRHGDESLGVDAGIAMPSFFRVLNLAPAAGRLLRDEDQLPGAEPVAVISHELWQRALAGGSDVVGSTVALDEVDHRIVGILQEGVEMPFFGRALELWTPLHFDPRDPEVRSWRGFVTIGRLRADATLAEAQADIEALQAALATAYPESNDGWGVNLRGLHEYLVREARPRLLFFLGAVGLVLLVACANVANLMLARATARASDYAVRAALGASRARLLRLQLAESTVLAGLGALAGMVVAAWVTAAFVAMAPGGIPRLEEAQLDLRVLGFAAALTGLVTVVSGLAPAISASRRNIAPAISAANVARGGAASGRGRDLLVIAEVAIAVVLVIGAGLMGRAFLRYLEWRPAFDPDQVMATFMLSSDGKYPTGLEVLAAHEDVAGAVAALPGVGLVGLGSAGPEVGGRETGRFRVEGQVAADSDSEPVLRWHDVDPNYFAVFGMEVVRGRGIAAADRQGAPQVAVIGESAARRYFAGADPIGRAITWIEAGATFEIVGVVQDVAPLGPGEAPEPAVYWPMAQLPRWGTVLFVRVDGDAGLASRAIADRLAALDPDLQARPPRTVRELAGRKLTRPRFNAALIGTFAGIALTLAAIGVYGLLSYLVVRRTHEFGVRLALGESPAGLLRGVLGRGLWLTAVGLVLGTAGALALGRLLQGFIADVPATDPLTFGLTTATFLTVAALACLRPAWRASRLDPTEALRSP